MCIQWLVVAYCIFITYLTAIPASLSSASHLPLVKGKKPAAMHSTTKITCTKEATFTDNADAVEFLGQVIVRDVNFKLCCDRLILALSKDHRGMRHAEAVGNVRVIQEDASASESTIRSVGCAGRAHYNPFTGNILLTEWPKLQKGGNQHIAMEKQTRMILNKNGSSHTIGQSKTVIVEK